MLAVSVGNPRGQAWLWELVAVSLSESTGIFIYVYEHPVGSGGEGAKPGTPPWQAAALAQAADAGLDPQAPRGNTVMDLGRGWASPLRRGSVHPQGLFHGPRGLKPLTRKTKLSFSGSLGKDKVVNTSRTPTIGNYF